MVRRGRMIWKRILPGLFLVVAFILGLQYILTNFYDIDLRPRTLWFNVVNPAGNRGVGIGRQEMADSLLAIQAQLRAAHSSQKPISIEVLESMDRVLFQLDPTYAAASSMEDGFSERSRSNPSSIEVCPEIYVNSSIGYPYFDKGWEMLECNDSTPIQDLVSIIIQPNSYVFTGSNHNCSQSLSWVLRGIGTHYPKVNVYVGVHDVVDDNCDARATAAKYSNAMLVPLRRSSGQPGKGWNDLLGYVTTPYVLVGRNLDHFTKFTNLERLVRMAGTTSKSNKFIVGGAVRNFTGHWETGCYQSQLKNYVLEYKDGYRISTNECIFCDHLSGPFLTKTELFRDVHFDEDLEANVLFEDFFLQVKDKEGILPLSCPDVLHFASDYGLEDRLTNKESWLGLVKKWELNRILLNRGGIKHSYTCEQSGLTCKLSFTLTKSFLMPICCVEQYLKAFKLLQEVAHKFNVRYELDSGSVLAAVKMRGVIPWDIDADVSYSSLNHSFFEKAVDMFRKRGLILHSFSPTTLDLPHFRVVGGFFKILTPDLDFEMFGMTDLSSDVFLPPELRNIPTKVNMNGVWVFGPANPGLYARNRYGAQIFRHSQSWKHVGQKSSWEDYTTVGHFRPCTKHNHHACLDRFFTDGNIQFDIP